MLARFFVRGSGRSSICCVAAIVSILAMAVVGSGRADTSGRSASTHRASESRRSDTRSLAAAKCGKISFGTPTAFTIPSSGGVACMTTSRVNAGARFSLKVDSNGCCGSWFANILDPNGVQVGYCELHCNGGSDFMDATTMNSTGVYTVQFAGSPGTATLTLYNVPPDVTGTVTPTSGSGSSVTIPITTPGQNARITLNGIVNHRLSWIHSGSVGNYGTALLDSSSPQKQLAECGWNCGGGSTFLEPYKLLYTGTYTVFFNPMWNRTGTETITFYDVPPDLNIGLNFDSSGTASATMPIGTPGQNARLSFQGYAGQALRWTQTGTVSIYGTDLYDPSGVYVTSCGYSCNGGSLSPTTLPATGAYTVVFNPFYNQTGTETITLHVSPGFTVKITGLANVGETDTAFTGAPSPPATSWTYQWQRCDPRGVSCADVAGQTDAPYIIGQGDLGSSLRVRVRGTNAFGSTTVVTPPTIPILGPLADLALNYRPALLFHLGNPAPTWDAEKYRPLEIHNFFAEPSSTVVGQQGIYICYQITACYPLGDPQGQLASGNSDQSYLDISDAWDPGCYHHVSTGATAFDCESGSHTAIYFEPGQDDRAYHYLDYWFFYRTNRPVDVTFGELDDHDGDWEGMTVALDGFNPSSVTLAYVWYAAHNGGQWYDLNALVAANALTGTHAKDYVANGTHASYPTQCLYACSTPANVPWPEEAPHDGFVSWGANDDGLCAQSCVQRFTENWWTYWAGRWGASRGPNSAFGWSPPSPGQQPRFACTDSGFGSSCTNPGRPPGARLLSGRGSTAKPTTPRVCRAWFGGNTSVLACDPKLLVRAIRTHRMRQRGGLHLFVNGRRGGDSPGLAQVIGQPLVYGDRITITGHGTPRTIFLVAIRVGLHLYEGRLRYSSLPRAARTTLTIARSGTKPAIRVRGRTLPAKMTRLR